MESGVTREETVSTVAPVTPGQREADRRELLRKFVQAYWLRPENAFWMTLRSQTLSRIDLGHPCIDICCGDGVFTFLHCGGAFGPDFDVFAAVGRLDRVRDDHVDMFDFTAGDYRPKILATPGRTIDVGIDWKKTLLTKASRLNLYDELIEHDSNKPFPFDDDAFHTIYCNAAYWVSEIDSFLGEIRRITQPGGRAILQVKLDSLRRYTLADHEAALGKRFLDIIGRGRVETWPTVADQATWEARFARAGLTLESATPFVTRTHAHIWDIGLRPIAPMLIRMAGALTPETRSSIKRDWVDLFCELLEPLCDPNFDLSANRDEPAEVQYVLTPL